MARRRMARSDMPHNPATVVGALRACRDTMVDVMRVVKPFGPVYKAARAITTAIDAMAYLLTGEKEYFWDNGTGAFRAEAQDLSDELARETGEKPWRSPTL
jgi:hypothetical protein